MRSNFTKRAATICCGIGAAALVTAPPVFAEPTIPPPGPVVEEGTPHLTPHLSSLENLPPGTSADPVDPPQGRGLSYLRDIWHAMQTQDVSFNEALFLLTQRPLDPAATPPPGMPVGPQPPPAPLHAPMPEAALP